MHRPPSRRQLAGYAFMAFTAMVVIGLAAPHLPRVATIASNLPIRGIDGDTFQTAAGERVRILNLDAPETPPQSCCSTEASLALR
jgi:hypothetical protein